MISRRQAIKQTALATAAIAAYSALPTAQAQPADPKSAEGAIKLPPLPYSADALEPHIDARTMEIHHGKHHAAYVNNLNKALAEAPVLAGTSLESILSDLDSVPEKIRSAVRNNGGGHFNHALFWQMMKKDGGGEPKGELARAIEKNFGSFSDFKHQFTESATKVFGSGWAWLIATDGKLKIETAPNQDAPVGGGRTAILGLDVWEHAYYLKYQNRRPEYIAAWFNVVNWDFASSRLAAAKG